MRIEFKKPQREPAFQVTLDVLKLSPCYPAFLITAEVLKIYMHQFWNTIKKIKDTHAYQFKQDKKKFQIDIEVFRKILQVCPEDSNQDFVEPPSDEEMVSFIKDLEYTSKCDMLSEIHTDQMHHPWRTFIVVISRCISEKSTAIQDSKEYKIYLAFANGEATPKKANVSSKKPSRKQSTGVQIRDTPGVSVSKKKAPATTDRSKGIDLLSEAALLGDAQMKKVLKRSKRETHSHQASGSGDGVGSQPKVPDELQDKTTGTNEGTESGDDDDSNDDDVSDDDGNEDDSDDDGGDNDSESERTEFDEDENHNLNQNDDDIEDEYEDEYVRTTSSYEYTDDENKHVEEEEYDRIDEELYKDVNVKLKDVEHGEEGKRDAEIIDIGQDDVTQETTYDQVKDDAHVTLTTAHVSEKTEVPLQSSSVSSDFAT
ncbi:hypothetical protein Tco_1038982 [Tanacetum coccineum]